MNNPKINKYHSQFNLSLYRRARDHFSGLNTIYIGDNLEGGSDPRREGIAIGGQ